MYNKDAAPRKSVRETTSRVALLLVLAIATASCAGATGASPGPSTPRPRLGPGADTASAAAYHVRGVEILRRDPDAAALHFQWASRLAPDRSEPLQGWRAALLIRNLGSLSQLLYSSGRETPVSRMADSLFYEGMLRSPFAYRQFDAEVREAFLELFQEEMGQAGYNRGQARMDLEAAFREGDPELRAWDHYVRREWDQALTDYAAALKAAKGDSKGQIHVERAHVFGVSGRLGPARDEMAAALAAFQAEDAKEDELRPFYLSKAMYQYVIGALWEVEGNVAEARASYGQAVVEDMSFHPAHVSLARLALAGGDTALAASEYRMAAELRPADAVLRVQYASFLAATGETEPAIEQLRAAIDINPWWASPHRSLGALCEKTQQYQAAFDAYSGFLARAAADDPDRPATVERRDLVASRIK